IPDPKWGQTPVALVVFHAGKSVEEDELKEFCRDHLADYKVPKQIRPTAELPLTGAGKLNRNAVVTMFS
ncbi:MAG: p-hydroxycinnamoyl-CoA synthetase, partial [Candidatus Competibacter sp.]|nr:p-hydroxycinnamoyl-CoA synthetase [Candidatus Competibacter sp.]